MVNIEQLLCYNLCIWFAPVLRLLITQWLAYLTSELFLNAHFLRVKTHFLEQFFAPLDSLPLSFLEGPPKSMHWFENM